MTSALIGLTGQEGVFLLVAVGPLVLAVAVCWLVWRWAKRSEDGDGGGKS